MTDAYIFDLDDTIIDSSIYSRMYHEVINQLLRHLGIKELELQEVITRLKQESRREKVDTFELAKKLNSTEIYYDVLERYARHTYTLKTKEIPKLFRKIKDVKKKIGVVSNSQPRTIEIFLKRFNLFDYVDFTESGKKDTILFWMTLEKRHDLNKEETLVIDDSDDILKVAEHTGYKVFNVKDIETLVGFSF